MAKIVIRILSDLDKSWFISKATDNDTEYQGISYSVYHTCSFTDKYAAIATITVVFATHYKMLRQICVITSVILFVNSTWIKKVLLFLSNCKWKQQRNTGWTWHQRTLIHSGSFKMRDKLINDCDFPQVVLNPRFSPRCLKPNLESIWIESPTLPCFELPNAMPLNLCML